MTEVLLDMENTNALITVAMLAAIYENQQKDYLDIIKPFVCNLLPARNEYIDFFSYKAAHGIRIWFCEHADRCYRKHC